MIYFVRHGETDYNSELRLQGQTDVPLNMNGIRQAYDTAERLTHFNIDEIISSDLIRASETARIISSRLDMSYKTDRRLREIYLGEWEGRVYPELRKTDKAYAEFFDNPKSFVPTHSESYHSLMERLNDFLNELDGLRDYLLVTHGFVMYQFILSHIEEGDACPGILNCEIISYDMDNDIVKRNLKGN